MSTENIYTVPELAKQLGLTERAIRFYESKGLIAPKRAGNTRIFNYQDRARLIIIKRAKNLGFSLSDIKNYLDLYDVDLKHQKQLKLALTGIQEKLQQLEKQEVEIKITISELKSLKKELTSSTRQKD